MHRSHKRLQIASKTMCEQVNKQHAMDVAFYILAALVAVSGAVFGPRQVKDIRKKQAYQNTYAIQNVGNDKVLRVLDAGTADSVPIILYSLHNWECITWQVIALEDGSCLLKNLYSKKAMEANLNDNTLWQQTMGGTSRQYWVMEALGEETFRLRLRDSNLYLTATSSETNSEPKLFSATDDESQLWRLIRQTPIM